MFYNQSMNDSSATNTSPAPDSAPAIKRRQCPCTLASGLTNGFYYLALGTWLGAIVMLAISAAATFQTVRAFEPSLHVAPWDQPEHASHAPSVLAGAIVGSSLNGLKVVQVICALIVVVALIAQHTLFRQYLACTVTSVRNLVRLLLVAGPVAILLLNIFWITPQILEHRDRMWDMSQPAEVREQAKEDFDFFHKMSERTTGMTAFALAGCVLVSSLVLGHARKESQVTTG